MEWDFDMSGVSTPVGDMVDGIKRGWDGIQDGAGEVIDRLVERSEEVKRRRVVRLAAVAFVAYLLLRRNR